MGEFRRSGVAIEKLKTIVVATSERSRNDVETTAEEIRRGGRWLRFRRRFSFWGLVRIGIHCRDVRTAFLQPS